MLIHAQISTLHNGVSEQQAELRLASQCSEMVNCLSTVNVGLRRRNPTSKIATGISRTSTDYTYSYDRGISGAEAERYVITVNASGIKVIDVTDGSEKTVTIEGSALNYLSPFGEYNGYSMVTVKDTTFVTNRNKIVETTTSGAAVDYDKEAYYWVKINEPVSGYTYSVTVDGTTKTATATTTTAAAIDLANQLNSISGFTAEVNSSIVKVYKTDNSDFTFSSDDSYGGLASVGWKGAVNTISDLPKNMYGFTNVYVRIAGAEGTVEGAYYLVYNDLTWQETKDPLNVTILDDTTMPHKLVRNSDGSFTFSQLEYDDRDAGDEDTNETPYFVGNTIKDIFFFANRLCMLSDNSLNMSEIGKYYNFYRTTVLALLDSDTINVNIDAKQALKMSYAIENQSTLVLFSDKAQFVVNTSGLISPKTVEVKQSTAYVYNNSVRPVVSNGSLFFVSSRNNNTAIYEYINDTYSDIQKIGTDVTAHVQTYIDSDIINLVSLPVHNMLFAQSKTNRDILYVYKYMYDGETRIQASWSKWQFNGDVKSIHGFNDTLYMLMDRNSPATALDWILSDGIWDDIQVWNDDAVWKDSEDTIEQTLEKITMSPINLDETFLDNGDTEYESSVELSEWIYKSSTNRDIRGHLQFKTVQLSSEEGSEFELEIKNIARNTSRTVDARYTTENRKPFVMAKSKDTRIEIKSNATSGFQINTVSFEGNLNQRSKGTKE